MSDFSINKILENESLKTFVFDFLSRLDDVKFIFLFLISNNSKETLELFADK